MLKKDHIIVERSLREICAWDKEELCTDKTVGASRDLLEHFFSSMFKKENSECMNMILNLNHVYGGYCL